MQIATQLSNRCTDNSNGHVLCSRLVMSSRNVDVVVVGAGISGLAAARTLSRYGARVCLLEASRLIGGRLRTLRVHDWPMPIELGAEFVHGEPTTTLALADAEGLELKRLQDRHAILRSGQLQPLTDVWQRFAKALEPALDVTSAWSLQKFVEQHELSADEKELVQMLVEGYHAAPLADVSARAIAEDASASAAEFHQYRVGGGYDRVISKILHELPKERVEIQLGCRVQRVAWRPGEVRLSVEGEREPFELTAPRCLASVSVGVLQAGSLQFDPAIEPHRQALKGIGMGHVIKAVLCFEHPPFGATFDAPRGTDFLHDREGDFDTLWWQTVGSNHQITLWAGGPKASRLSPLSKEQLRERALASAARLLAADSAHLARDLIGLHSHDFGADPLTLGAYSYVRPGNLHAARLLSLPVANTLFFCGEALDLAYPGTVAGALGSGQHAARQILATLGHAP